MNFTDKGPTPEADPWKNRMDVEEGAANSASK